MPEYATGAVLVESGSPRLTGNLCDTCGSTLLDVPFTTMSERGVELLTMVSMCLSCRIGKEA